MQIAAETHQDDDFDNRLVEDSRTDMSKSSLDVGKRVCLDSCNPKKLKSRKDTHDRDRTVLLLRREIESALKSLKEVEDEMEKLRKENKEMSNSEQQTRESLKFFTAEILNLQAKMYNFESQSKIKMEAANQKLAAFEEIVLEASSLSSRMKEVNHHISQNSVSSNLRDWKMMMGKQMANVLNIFLRCVCVCGVF